MVWLFSSYSHNRNVSTSKDLLNQLHHYISSMIYKAQHITENDSLLYKQMGTSSVDSKVDCNGSDFISTRRAMSHMSSVNTAWLKIVYGCYAMLQLDTLI